MHFVAHWRVPGSQIVDIYNCSGVALSAAIAQLANHVLVGPRDAGDQIEKSRSSEGWAHDALATHLRHTPGIIWGSAGFEEPFEFH